MELHYPPGATPLDPDEISGLIPIHINTHGQLNEWEADNIIQAENWLASITHHENFLTLAFTQQLHQKMFNKTWSWAGKFRTTEKNIGVEPAKITTELTHLFDDIIYQLIHDTYSIDEIAYRFHHRLVSIHPFANGNGRHARMMTDLLLSQAGESKFTWGSSHLTEANTTRKKYIDALRAADKHDYRLLAKFVRS